MEVNVIWLKRDLRLSDHKPLAMAAQCDLPVLLIYCYEPSLMATRESDERHWRFVMQSVEDMNARLSAYGTRVLCLHDEVKSAFDRLRVHYTIHTVYSYQETGLSITFGDGRCRTLDAY